MSALTEHLADEVRLNEPEGLGVDPTEVTVADLGRVWIPATANETTKEAWEITYTFPAGQMTQTRVLVLTDVQFHATSVLILDALNA